MARSRLLARAATLLLPCALAACAGNGAGLDQGGRPLAPGGSSGGPLVATFQSIQDNVFTPVCTVCHAGAAAPQGLRLDAANSYAMLVGVPSAEVGSLLRVRAGDPDNSYLIQKLEGHAAVGAQMPFGGPYLPAATIAVIRQWITDGAAPPPPAASLGFTLLSVAPAPLELLATAPAHIVLWFSADLDRTRIDAASLRLERIEATGFVPQATGLRVPDGNASALLIEPAQPLAPGHYRLVMLPSPATGLAGLSGERLGGDGVPGEALVITDFEVTTPP